MGALRDDSRLDLAGSLRRLVAGIPTPAVHLSVGEDLGPIAPAVAHALFRCVQEALTNAVRHARADEIWIDLAADGPGRLELVIRDDGIGAARVEPGLGLTGVRERVEALGGRLAIDGRPDVGLRLSARVPTRAPEAA